MLGPDACKDHVVVQFRTYTESSLNNQIFEFSKILWTFEDVC